jgi:hypothetical protein
LRAAPADQVLWLAGLSGVMLPQPMIPKNANQRQRTLQVVYLSWPQ